jgi:hypothetical protein
MRLVFLAGLFYFYGLKVEFKSKATQGLRPRISISYIVAAKQAAEKVKFLSFRGTLRAEESLILLTLEPREIPYFVRNDKIVYFFHSV